MRARPADVCLTDASTPADAVLPNQTKARTSRASFAWNLTSIYSISASDVALEASPAECWLRMLWGSRLCCAERFSFLVWRRAPRRSPRGHGTAGGRALPRPVGRRPRERLLSRRRCTDPSPQRQPEAQGALTAKTQRSSCRFGGPSDNSPKRADWRPGRGRSGTWTPDGRRPSSGAERSVAARALSAGE